MREPWVRVLPLISHYAETRMTSALGGIGGVLQVLTGCLSFAWWYFKLLQQQAYYHLKIARCNECIYQLVEQMLDLYSFSS